MNATWEIRQGDALERLREMPDESVQCCVTSPPYFGLRDYGTGSWEGGDPACSHEDVVNARRTFYANSVPGPASSVGKNAPSRNMTKEVGGECADCGASRVDLQIGLEPTPDEFVDALVAVFREVRRVLRDDGTLWLNLGDSYAAKPRGEDASWCPKRIAGPGLSQKQQAIKRSRRSASSAGAKPKDLLGIPWMVAFALRADGWYLRRDIIWAKPNPMPESVTDRPTTSHEYLFLLSKGPRYFYDADAIREPDVGADHARNVLDGQPSLEPSNGLASPHRGLRTPAGRNGSGRNRRSVWTIATRPYPAAHFATFPPDLVEPCILAGAAPGHLVLDCFAGAGTTGLVATRRGRGFLGIELNPEYVELGRQRIRDDAPLMNYVTEAAA